MHKQPHISEKTKALKPCNAKFVITEKPKNKPVANKPVLANNKKTVNIQRIKQ